MPLPNFWRPWGAWPQRLRVSALAGGLIVSAGGLALQWQGVSSRLTSAQERLARSTAAVQSAGADEAAARTVAGEPAAADVLAKQPGRWPEQTQALEVWVRESAQLAARHSGVQLIQLSITRPNLGPEGGTATVAAPYAVLKVSTKGPYAALKAWQSSMQELMPTLGVESLRWQAPPNDGSAVLSAEWVWRLWVRPARGGDGLAGDDAEGTVAGRGNERPPLAAALRDPFGMAVAVPPPVVVPAYVAPVPVSAPVAEIAPPPHWTTVGVLKGSDGRFRVSGHWGNETEVVSMAEGDTAANGYKVTRITKTQMELRHPQTGESLSVRLPVAPRFEIR